MRRTVDGRALRKALKEHILKLAKLELKEVGVELSKNRLEEIFSGDHAEGMLDNVVYDIHVSLETYVNNKLQDQCTEEEWPS